MNTLKNLKGKIFNHLTVTDGPFVYNKITFYKTKCVCGTIKEVNAYWLKNKAKSCGCKSGFKHGHCSSIKKSPEYSTLDSMIQRCTNKKHKAFKNYGGRGIRIINSWLDFSIFYKDMGKKPINMSLDRIDNNKGYSKSNCRWASKIDQCNNTRRNKYYNYKDKKLTLSEISRETGIHRNILQHHISRKNKDINKFIEDSNGKYC